MLIYISLTNYNACNSHVDKAIIQVKLEASEDNKDVTWNWSYKENKC